MRLSARRSSRLAVVCETPLAAANLWVKFGGVSFSTFLEPAWPFWAWEAKAKLVFASLRTWAFFFKGSDKTRVFI